MHDALAVGGLQGAGHGQAESGDLARGQALAPGEQPVEARAVHELHGDEGRLGGVFDVVHRDDVRVAETGDRDGLAQQPRNLLGRALRLQEPQGLERHGALQLRVVGLEHRSHPAVADRLEHLVAAQGQGQGHGPEGARAHAARHLLGHGHRLAREHEPVGPRHGRVGAEDHVAASRGEAPGAGEAARGGLRDQRGREALQRRGRVGDGQHLARPRHRDERLLAELQRAHLALQGLGLGHQPHAPACAGHERPQAQPEAPPVAHDQRLVAAGAAQHALHGRGQLGSLRPQDLAAVGVEQGQRGQAWLGLEQPRQQAARLVRAGVLGQRSVARQRLGRPLPAGDLLGDLRGGGARGHGVQPQHLVGHGLAVEADQQRHDGQRQQGGAGQRQDDACQQPWPAEDQGRQAREFQGRLRAGRTRMADGIMSRARGLSGPPPVAGGLRADLSVPRAARTGTTSQA
jgi:hypothetical protein